MLEKLTLHTDGFLRPSTTLHPDLQLQQAASDITTGESEEAADVTQIQLHSLSQTHQLQVTAHIHLRKDAVNDRLSYFSINEVLITFFFFYSTCKKSVALLSNTCMQLSLKLCEAVEVTLTYC